MEVVYGIPFPPGGAPPGPIDIIIAILPGPIKDIVDNIYYVYELVQDGECLALKVEERRIVVPE